MSRSEQTVIQVSVNFTEKGGPNRARISSRYYAGILEQMSFVLCLDMQRKEKRERST